MSNNPNYLSGVPAQAFSLENLGHTGKMTASSANPLARPSAGAPYRLRKSLDLSQNAACDLGDAAGAASHTSTDMAALSHVLHVESASSSAAARHPPLGRVRRMRDAPGRARPSTADGYYALEIDWDGNGNFETVASAKVSRPRRQVL